MPNLRGLALSFKQRGILGLFSHGTSILFGDPRLYRPASTLDMRLAKMEFVSSIVEAISKSCPNQEESLTQKYIIEAEEAIGENLANLTDNLFHPSSWDSGEFLQILLYVSVRILKPAVVVETGTANGRSASAITSALSANDFGHLYSYDVLKTDAPYIQQKNRSYVSLITLNGKPESLKKHIESLPQIAGYRIFLHDSDHSYPNQLSDYETARKCGFDLLISDDVDASLAFCDFAKENGSVLLDGSKIIGFCSLR